jgi:hypothetical protein
MAAALELMGGVLLSCKRAAESELFYPDAVDEYR